MTQSLRKTIYIYLTESLHFLFTDVLLSREIIFGDWRRRRSWFSVVEPVMEMVNGNGGGGDEVVDHWRIENFDPSWNEHGMLEVSSFSTLFPQYIGQIFSLWSWPTIRLSYYDLFIYLFLYSECLCYIFPENYLQEAWLMVQATLEEVDVSCQINLVSPFFRFFLFFFWGWVCFYELLANWFEVVMCLYKNLLLLDS